VTRYRALLALALVESYATILVERAIFFYTGTVLGYSDQFNLFMALSLGVFYIIGAKCSHVLAARLGEKRVLWLTIIGQLVVHLFMWQRPTVLVLITGNVLIGLLNGLKWPVVESYVGAGRKPKEASRALGQFNMAWSLGVPLSLVTAGPIIAYSGSGLFLAAAIANAVACFLLIPFEARPVHLPVDHPDKPDPVLARRYGYLLSASRWSMLSAYSLLFLLSPLIPGVFTRLGVPLIYATGLAGLLDLTRWMTFAVMARYTGWHGKGWVAAVPLLGLPLGFYLILYGSSLLMVISGEVLFGVTAGIAYYAALYYVMILLNAAVEAGGEHEGLIGLGFCLGPAVGLLGGWTGYLALTCVPLILVCLGLSLRSMIRLRQVGH
jgi:MFS family permease